MQQSSGVAHKHNKKAEELPLDFLYSMRLFKQRKTQNLYRQLEFWW